MVSNENNLEDVNINERETKNLNSNHEARNNVDMNASKESTQKPGTGNDDVTNIN